MLFNEIMSNVLALGLHPYVGFMHKIAKGHPALVSDLIEEWRAPLIDSMVLAMIKRNMLTRDMFEINEAGCFLNTEARKIYLQTYNKSYVQITNILKINILIVKVLGSSVVNMLV